MPQPTVIIVCGPTATGKTVFAIRLANHFNTEIISADSRQCYTELNIGVAKPAADELSLVHHYFINSHSIHNEVNAGVFEEYALYAAQKILASHSTAVMVGGTGLYIKTFCEGMDILPAVDPAIRQHVIGEYEEMGLTHLQKQVEEKDPNFWELAERQNPQRLMRALEFVLSTGKSITNFRTQKKVQRPFNIIKIGLDLPKEELYHRINTRVDTMIEQGLQDEVYQLLPYRHLNALQTVGYKEFFDFYDGNISLGNAVDHIKTNTRHYSKRQQTWFKKDINIHWFPAEDEGLFENVTTNIAGRFS